MDRNELNRLFENRRVPIWNESVAKTSTLWDSGLNSLQIALRRRISESTVIQHLATAIELDRLSEPIEIDTEDISYVAEFFANAGDLKLAAAHEHFEGRFDYDDLNLIRGTLGYFCRKELPFPWETSSSNAWRVVLAERNEYGEKKMKKRWVIVVIDQEKWEALEDLRGQCSNDEEWCEEATEIVMPRKHTHYSHLELTSGVRVMSSRVDAYLEAYRWLTDFDPYSAEVHGERTKSSSVYAMKMFSDCWDKGAFCKANSSIPEEERGQVSCLYVGQTGGAIKDRYEEHIGDGELSSKWGRDHFYEPFQEAYDDEIKALRAQYSLHSGVKLSEMTLGESLIHEQEFGEWLKSRGYAVYYK